MRAPVDTALGRSLVSLALVTAEQGGVCTLDQARAAGLTVDAVRRLVGDGRWVRLHRAVYRTTPGAVPLTARMWGAHLALGPTSVLSHSTAAHYWGLVEGPDTGPTTILVPEHCTRVARGVRTRRVRDPQARAHPARRPPVTTVNQTVCDLVADCASDAVATEIVLRACRLRLTSPDRLREVAGTRARQGRRRLLESLCTEVAEGVTSPLEREYRTSVARAHGLPAARLQSPADTTAARRSYQDVAYSAFGVVVELDGRLGHEQESDILRDQLRDNACVLSGAATLRFGWLAVIGQPCAVAGQVAELLRLRGWEGRPRPCARACALGEGRPELPRGVVGAPRSSA